MSREYSSRREFLKFTATIMGGGWLAANANLVIAAADTAQQSLTRQTAFSHLSAAEAQTLAALSDQIFPPDEKPGTLPGASELGAVHFIDAALGTFMAGALGMIQQGIVDLDQRAGSSTGSSTAFHQLSFDQQTALAQEIESTAFFGAVHFLTLCGLFALPSYGGNANHAAWKMIGFESRHVWQPPFGYYDAEYAKEQNHASS